MKSNIFYGWWVVWSCFFIALYVSSIVFFGLTAFFEPLVKEFGWSYTQISFAASLRGMEMGLFAPVIGFLVDRWGSRRLIICGFIIMGCGLILLAFTHSLTTFYASFILLAFGAGGCTSVVTAKAVADWFDKNSGLAFGIMSSGFGASGLLVPIIVLLIDTCGWRTTLIIFGVGMWVVGIPLSLIIRSGEQAICTDSVSAKMTNLSETMDYNDKDEYKLDFKSAVKDRFFFFFILVEMVRMMTLSAVVLHIMPHLSNVGIPRYSAGIIAAAMPLCSIVGRIGFGWLGDIYDKRYILTICCGLMALGMVCLCYVNTTGIGPYLFLFFFSLGFGGVLVLRASIVRAYYGREIFGKMVGILMGCASIGGIVGPTLAGLVFDMRGSYYTIWLVFAILLFLVAAVIPLISPPSRATELRGS